ncbi:MAG: penicillin-binding protein [Desulfovibrionales bacterium]
MIRRRSTPSIDWTKFRLRMVAVVFLLVLGGLWARAYHIQIVRGPDLALKAQRQYWTKEYESGKRGEIYDRNGILLAKTIQVNSVYARPVQVLDVPGTAAALSTILGIEEKKLYSLLKQKKNFVWINRKTGDRQAAALAKANLPGVYQTYENERLYPQGNLAGQLLGFVGVDNEGLEGLERSFDEFLRGAQVKNVVQRDARGQILYAGPGTTSKGIQGGDLHLTIDSRVQNAAEEALARSVLKHKAKDGMALVVEVKTGEILGWANYPFFNPNRYRDHVRTPVRWRNRISLDVFEPGSTMKPFLIAAALEENLCSPSSIFFCEEGKWHQKGFSIKDTKEYGWLSVNRILSLSSNICAAKIGLAMGAETYHDYLKRFGFGRTTSLNLPGESAGMIRPTREWYPVDLATASFGQGIAVTALQLAQGYLSLANQGTFKPLRLIKNQTDGVETGEQVVSPETARAVLDMLRETVSEGTGTQAAIDGLLVGGKTGTAQKATAQGGYGKEYMSSFIGLIPALDPEYLLVVIVDEPEDEHYGGVVAAPAVREIALQTLSFRGELPDQYTLTAAGPERISVSGTSGEQMTRVDRPAIVAAEGMMPDLRGMSLKEAMEILATQGIVPTLEGSGIYIERQSPAPGSRKPKDGQRDCRLWLTDAWRNS